MIDRHGDDRNHFDLISAQYFFHFLIATFPERFQPDYYKKERPLSQVAFDFAIYSGMMQDRDHKEGGEP